MKIFTTVIALLTFQLTAFAQMELPYYSGFDNDDQQVGWAEYKTASTEFSHWNLTSAGGFSDPNSISHDYSPSTGITLTDNWFISPGFSIESGGTLDSIRYKFSGFSTPVEGDTIGVYLLNGSQDPELASSIDLLIDFRNDEYVNDFEYHVKTAIALPAHSGLSYIGIRYRNTECSSKWLTVAFDNIAVNGNPLAVDDLSKTNIRVFPNPTKELLTISGDKDISSIKVYNTQGQTVFSHQSYTPGQPINLAHLSKGLYVLTLQSGNQLYSQKVLIE